MTANALAAGLGLALDRLLGEPPVRVHPVALFGSAMTEFERRFHQPTRRRGLLYTSCGVSVSAGAGAVARRLLGPFAGTAAVSAAAMAARMLERESQAVADLLAVADLDTARQRVGGLVGRHTDDLSEAEVCRAVIESLAENTVDAVTATVFWATFGGAIGAATHRGVNTMDAMVGHRNERFERFGWASARLDDVANWIPARLTAIAVIGATPRRAVEIVRTVRSDASQHPSPNGGVVEAAFAAALGIKLGGANVYGGVVDDRGELGDGRPPTVGDIERAAQLARKVAVLSLLISGVVQMTAVRLARQLAR